MALLTLVEAAIESGFSVELVERLTRTCPKRGDEKLLPVKTVDDSIMIDDRDLDAYCRYLREPWPLPKKGNRPTIPSYIKDDVLAESHYECAICGAMDNGEVAHIDGVAASLDNSPDNLILLCPRHHTKYDLGYAPASNVTKDVVLAAKKMKRAARRRMLRYEGNATVALQTALRVVKATEESARTTDDELLRQTYETEVDAILKALPEITEAAQRAAAKDEAFEGATHRSLRSHRPSSEQHRQLPAKGAQPTSGAP